MVLYAQFVVYNSYPDFRVLNPDFRVLYPDFRVSYAPFVVSIHTLVSGYCMPHMLFPRVKTNIAQKCSV